MADTSIATREPLAIDAPLPVFTGPAMIRAFQEYRELQAALDELMPDQMVEIGGNWHRCKGYWNALGVAFNVSITLIEERREVYGAFEDGREHFGYYFVVEAKAPNGRAFLGDGACTAVEKAAAFRCPHPHPTREGFSLHYPHDRCPDYSPGYRYAYLPIAATEHNVRAHAFTRAINRAISGLVGFGEVSAEEADGGPVGGDTSARVAPPARPANNSTRPSASHGRGADTRVISEPQAKRLWTIARQHGWNEDAVHTLIRDKYATEHVHEITRDRYDAVIFDLEAGADGGGR